jgi:hypothetical protein
VSFTPTPVSLWSPLTLNECDERLRAATGHQGSLWYLRSENIGHKEPRFRGRVDATSLSIARFEETLTRDSFVPFLEATLAPGSNGGTDLRGSVGLNRSVRLLLWLMMPVGGLIVAVIFTVGVVLLVQGHGLSALPALLIPLVIAGFGTALVVGGMRRLRRRVEPLLADLMQIVESPPRDREQHVT